MLIYRQIVLRKQILTLVRIHAIVNYPSPKGSGFPPMRNERIFYEFTFKKINMQLTLFTHID